MHLLALFCSEAMGNETLGERGETLKKYTKEFEDLFVLYEMEKRDPKGFEVLVNVLKKENNK